MAKARGRVPSFGVSGAIGHKVRAKKGTTPTKWVKTAGGNYPVYPKGSPEAKRFREVHAAARKAGKNIFRWQTRKYSTKVR